MTLQAIIHPKVKAGLPAAHPGRMRTRAPSKVVYSAVQYLVGRGRWRPWLDCTVTELFQADTVQLKAGGRIPRAYSVRPAGSDDAPELGCFFGSRARVDQRLGRGDVCLVVVAADRICAGGWLALGPVTVEEDRPELRCRFRIPAGVAWGYDGRGAKPGAWGCLMARWPEHLADLGAKTIVTTIHYNNHLSIDSHLSLGYRSAGWVGCVRLLGLTLRRYRPIEGRWQRLPGRLGPIELLEG